MFRLIVTLLCLGLSTRAIANEYPAEMEFRVFQPCRGNASFCATRVLARGQIDGGASERLAKFLASIPFRTTIAFDSPGGSLMEGLRIGALIREGGHDSVVASSYSEEVVIDDQTTSIVALAENARCYSACAYAFMGGVSRTLEPDGRLGVHQFSGLDKESGESDAQVLTSVLSQYVTAMGVDRDVLDLAGLTDSASIAEVSKEHAVRYNLDNQQPPLAAWQLDVLDSGEIMVKVVQQLPGSDRTTAFMIGRSNASPNFLLVVVGYGSVDGSDQNAVRDAIRGLDAKASFCSGGFQDCVQATAVREWQFSSEKNRTIGLFRVEADALLRVVSKDGQFTFRAGFPNVVSHIAPDVDLQRTGLPKLLMAIRR